MALVPLFFDFGGAAFDLFRSTVEGSTDTALTVLTSMMRGVGGQIRMPSEKWPLGRRGIRVIRRMSQGPSRLLTGQCKNGNELPWSRLWRAAVLTGARATRDAALARVGRLPRRWRKPSQRGRQKAIVAARLDILGQRARPQGSRGRDEVAARRRDRISGRRRSPLRVL